MTSVILDPIKGRNYRLISEAVGGILSLLMLGLRLFVWYFDLIPLAIGLTITLILFHLAWKGFDEKTGRWSGKNEWRNTA